jgi:type II secretory pathway component PulJ
MKRSSQRCLILFELLIALTLIATLLSILFRFFANTVKIDHKIEETRQIVSEREYLHTRLANIFTALVPRSQLPEKTNFSFYTEHSLLVAVFDNGVDPDPLFSGPILSKIAIDKNKNLILTLTPLEQSSPRRKEILLTNVDSLDFQFLAKKDLQKPSPHAIPINQNAEWRSSWNKEQWELPSLIRVTVQQNERALSFAFPLPFPEPSIVYGGGK